ncbi:MAG: FAD-binding oxidoreductase [Pseudomonadota bacterium]
MKRRQFIHSALAAIPAAVVPASAWSCGKLFASAAAVSAELPDIEALTSCNKQFFLRGADVKEFAGRLRGELLLRDSAGYDTARRIWNGAFDRHPALIARCSGAVDIMEAVKFAADRELLVSVRGGGHSLSGQSVCEKGLMIDLSQMNSARVDPARRVATIEGGALLGALDREALAHGLATTAGTVSHTGVGGLTLGGGFGRLGRRFGLACDNVRSIDLVTAKGQLLTASKEQNQDLFWGLRGGGGNFGVATTFEFQLHPVDPVMIGGDLVYSFADAPAVLKFMFENAPHVPEELNMDISVLRLPNDLRLMSVNVCYSGTAAGADKALAGMRSIRKPIEDTVAPTPYVKLQQSGDVGAAAGKKYYIKGGFVQKSSAALVDVIMATIADAKLPVVQVVSLQQAGGAIARVSPKATAFAQRTLEFNMFAMAIWEDPAQSDAAGQWTRGAWKNIEPHTRGFYVNEFNDDAGRMQATYGVNYDRLVALKTKIDPNNLFRMNANIAPLDA